MGDIPTLSALVVGAGKSGGRFVRAIRYLERIGLPVRIAGVCDLNPSRLDIPGLIAPAFKDVNEALDVVRPDVVCVCVNESTHYEVLKAVSKRLVNVRLVLSEKPLTETLEQFADIERLFAPGTVTVNFVERYSPIVSDFNAWRDSQSVDMLRAEFFWGKYRFRDERPTMGVLSEISHPIDLVRALSGLPETTPVDIHEVAMSDSDFSCGDEPVADTVSVSFGLGSRVLVRGYSSFLWEERRRRVILFGRGADGTLYQAVLRFDEPRWDQDRLTVYALDVRTGARSPVLETRYTNSDFPAELDRIFKVTRFVRESLRRLSDPPAVKNLVTVGGARWVQEIIEGMAARARQASLPPVNFGTRDD